MANLVIYTDVGSCDPDDLLALMMLKHVNANILGIIATHHYPRKKAQLIKLLLNEIGLESVPVYVGSGLEYNETYDETRRTIFDNDNELWPSSFGYPIGVMKPDETPWFSNFMKAYESAYDSKEFESLHIEKESGYDMMVKLLSNSKDKVTVVCMAPPHDLAQLPVELYNNMNIWIMGGGFENYSCILNMCDSIDNPKLGYNWGICPGTIEQLLNNANESNTKINLISSGFIRRKNLNISVDKFNEWLSLKENKKLSKFMNAFIDDWIYCSEANTLNSHTNICDPVVLFAALNSNLFSSVPVNCNINGTIMFEDYLMESQSKVTNILRMKLMENTHTNVNLIVGVNSGVNNIIVDMINKTIIEP